MKQHYLNVEHILNLVGQSHISTLTRSNMIVFAIIHIKLREIQHAASGLCVSRSGTDLKSPQDAGAWASLAMPMRYIESAKIAN